jgi:hypothetical protein
MTRRHVEPSNRPEAELMTRARGHHAACDDALTSVVDLLPAVPGCLCGRGDAGFTPRQLIVRLTFGNANPGFHAQLSSGRRRQHGHGTID